MGHVRRGSPRIMGMHTHRALKVVPGPAGSGLMSSQHLSKGVVVLNGCPPPSTLGLAIVGGARTSIEVRDNPDLQSRLLQVGPEIWWAEDNDEALVKRLQLLRRATEEAPNSSSYLELAWHYFDAARGAVDGASAYENIEDAMHWTRAAAAVKANIVDVLKAEASCFAALNQFERAIQIYKDLIRDASSSELLVECAFFLNMAGRNLEALTLLQRASKGSSALWTLFVNGICLYAAGQYQKAIAALTALQTRLNSLEGADFCDFAAHTAWPGLGYSKHVQRSAPGRRGRIANSFLSFSEVWLDSMAYLAAATGLSGATNAVQTRSA